MVKSCDSEMSWKCCIGVKSHEQRGGIKLVMGKVKGRDSFVGRLKALENTMGFSSIYAQLLCSCA